LGYEEFFENSYAALDHAGGHLAFDYAGVCRPVQDVIGSFLEKHSMPAGKVVFAVGDAASAPDPLPVSCVRHHLRRGLSQERTNPAFMAESMNQLIYDCSAAQSLLSCFYGEYVTEGRVLRYVNAGHDAPILIRRNPDEIVRLEEGGPVLGLRESSGYAEGSVVLRKGDRLVAFTQGVLDSLANHDGQSAEKVLIGITRNETSSSAFRIAHRIVAECERTRAGRKLETSVFVAAVNKSARVSTQLETRFGHTDDIQHVQLSAPELRAVLCVAALPPCHAKPDAVSWPSSEVTGLPDAANQSGWNCHN
jgi:sigma-B regulation protein RsbU (phosphoserine phosphatase)